MILIKFQIKIKKDKLSNLQNNIAVEKANPSST